MPRPTWSGRRSTTTTARRTGATAGGWSPPWSRTWTPIRVDGPARASAEADAEILVDDLARRLAAAHVSLTEAVALFVAARRPFLAELSGLGRRRTLDPARLGALYEDASALLDRLLLRLIATHQAATR